MLEVDDFFDIFFVGLEGVIALGWLLGFVFLPGGAVLMVYVLYPVVWFAAPIRSVVDGWLPSIVGGHELQKVLIVVCVCVDEFVAEVFIFFVVAD